LPQPNPTTYTNNLSKNQHFPEKTRLRIAVTLFKNEFGILTRFLQTNAVMGIFACFAYLCGICTIYETFCCITRKLCYN